jgi:hypothetical protein
MTQTQFNSVLDKYKKEDKIYFGLLCRIMRGCSSHFNALLEKSESTSTRLFLIVDDEAEAAKDGIFTDGTIALDHIGFR